MQIGLWRSVHQQPSPVPDARDAAAAWAHLATHAQQAVFFVVVVNFRWNDATGKYDLSSTPWAYTRQPLGPGLAPPRPAQLLLDDTRIVTPWSDPDVAELLLLGSDGGPPLPGQHALPDQMPGNCGRPVGAGAGAGAGAEVVVSGWFAAPAGLEFLRGLYAACAARFPGLAVRMLKVPGDAMRLALGPHHALVFPARFPLEPVTASFSPEPFAIAALTTAEAERLVAALPTWLGT